MRHILLLLASAAALSLAGCDRHPAKTTAGSGAQQTERAERGQGHGLKRACRDDIEQFCVASQKGRERRECLQSHLDKLSDGCKQALSERRGHRGGGRRNRDAGTGTDDSE